jgi:uncharacterized protein
MRALGGMRTVPAGNVERRCKTPRLLSVAVLVGVSMAVSAANGSIPSDALLKKLQPEGLVSDFAGVLKPSERAALESRLTGLQRKAKSQFAVVTLQSLEGGQIDDFANKLFAKWGIGEKKKDNGILLLVAMQDRKARVEVGYGLEPILPDALAGRVLDEQLFPAFKQQRYAEGLMQAVERIVQIVERGEPAPPEARQGAKAGGATDGQAFALLFLSLFIVIGALALGAGIRGHACFFVLWGLMFGGIPTCIAWGISAAAGWSLWVPWAVTLFGVAMVVVGWYIPWKRPDWRRWGGTTSSTGGWWTWDGGSSGSSGGSWGGGFDSGGSFGGFGGGSSGGGGASGSW